MKSKHVLSLVASNCLIAMLATSVAWADDEADKLKQLESAMTAQTDRKPVIKKRTRAIVFDAAPQAEAQKAPLVEATKAPQIETQKAPLVEATKAPQIETQKAPQLEAIKAPQAEAQKAALVEATKAPQIEVQKASQVAAQKAPSIEANEAAPVNAVDCSKLDTDAKITAVDFPIQFKVGSAELTASSERTLQLISRILGISNNCVLIEGHTDSVGSPARNLELSRQRADSVVKFLSTKEGINQIRLVPLGKGSSEPLKDTDSRNPMNRRVVFKVVG